jgi:hypothetical protein
MLTEQVRGVTTKSRLGEPPVSATKDVTVPLLWAVSETVTGGELAPTVVVPEKVRGVFEIWAPAPAASASAPMTTSNRRFSALSMFETFVRRARAAEGEKLPTTLGHYRQVGGPESWLERSSHG